MFIRLVQDFGLESEVIFLFYKIDNSIIISMNIGIFLGCKTLIRDIRRPSLFCCQTGVIDWQAVANCRQTIAWRIPLHWCRGIVQCLFPNYVAKLTYYQIKGSLRCSRIRVYRNRCYCSPSSLGFPQCSGNQFRNEIFNEICVNYWNIEFRRPKKPCPVLFLLWLKNWNGQMLNKRSNTRKLSDFSGKRWGNKWTDKAETKSQSTCLERKFPITLNASRPLTRKRKATFPLTISAEVSRYVVFTWFHSN